MSDEVIDRDDLGEGSSESSSEASDVSGVESDWDEDSREEECDEEMDEDTDTQRTALKDRSINGHSDAILQYLPW